MNKSGILYLVPTPIGNLEDMTLRGIRILKEVDLILAEDTRTSSKLLSHFEIGNRLVSFHKFNEHKILKNIIDKLVVGENLALISDAGTPGISDPGFLLVRECHNQNIKVECLPGATALIPALAVSGLPSEKFVFEGFLPQKKGRQKQITALKEEPRTIVFYESPYRLIKTLTQLFEFWEEDRNCCVCRELSKLYEEVYLGTLSEAITHFEKGTIKGEIVIVVEGKNKKEPKSS